MAYIIHCLLLFKYNKRYRHMASKKDKMLVVRMTEQEWQELKAYAETEDCSMAAVIRKLLKKLLHVSEK